MAADLYIHVVENDEVEKHVVQYLRKEYSSGCGEDRPKEWCNFCTEYYVEGKWVSQDEFFDHPEFDTLVATLDRETQVREIRLEYDESIVDNCPEYFIGEVSWLKAALFDNEETFIPTPVMKVSEIISNTLPVIDDALIEALCAAVTVPNTTGYGVNSNAAKLREWLNQYKGKKLFQISW